MFIFAPDMGGLGISIIKALVIGLAASMPLGPVGIMCIQKTLGKGRLDGFSVGVGAALGDTTYATISLLSIAFIRDFIERNSDVVMLAGGAIIFTIGLKILLSNPFKNVKQQKDSGSGSIAEAARGFIMTLSNPAALVVMLGLFAYFRLGTGQDYKPLSAVLIILGVLTGTITWWFLLSGAVSKFRKKFKLNQIIAINRISGAIIATLGLISLIKGLVSIIRP